MNRLRYAILAIPLAAGILACLVIDPLSTAAGFGLGVVILAPVAAVLLRKTHP